MSFYWWTLNTFFFINTKTLFICLLIKRCHIARVVCGISLNFHHRCLIPVHWEVLDVQVSVCLKVVILSPTSESKQDLSVNISTNGAAASISVSVEVNGTLYSGETFRCPSWPFCSHRFISLKAVTVQVWHLAQRKWAEMKAGAITSTSMMTAGGTAVGYTISSNFQKQKWNH